MVAYGKYGMTVQTETAKRNRKCKRCTKAISQGEPCVAVHNITNGIVNTGSICASCIKTLMDEIGELFKKPSGT